ncbi:uncharacterized protein L3040_005886 [Drepanopeziza brunnea f. sp. 'multigermtubi']|uniref:uncharacterized protein n=1 Tax=Drepanopeziza brunnea f. sp. 'multigermtubi' TaxID=698441 RepID=UPI00239A0543|nr:hypothetical protein L3040_005886 [Drepanopeziza brunnea f. sp. 'multigermtubi']
MLFQQVTLAVLGLAIATEAGIITDTGISQMGTVRRQNKNAGGQGLGQEKGAAALEGLLCLSPENVQDASKLTGQETPTAGQSPSSVDDGNFINFCKGSITTNGLQNKAGSCNGIVMGKIPSTSNMVSGIITSPKPGENLPAGKTFTVSVQTTGLAAGVFTNPASTYYSAPQDLNGLGQIMGHVHMTIQNLGDSLAPTTAPDPVSFVFFKGINDVGDGNGLLSTTVTDGLPAGNYRLCTMISTANHQPVLMPVAQRGAQDDCQKFTVGAGDAAAQGDKDNGDAAASKPASAAGSKATEASKAGKDGKGN